VSVSSLPGDSRLPLEARGLPLERTSDPIAREYAGPVDIWDIDKTYLCTAFESIRDLLRRAFESALDKETRPGARALLHGLAAGPEGPAGTTEPAPLFFISASPPQLRPVREEKMHLDGLRCAGLTLKDHLALLRRGRLRDIKRHTGYKLAALLLYRLEWPAGVREWLYGDDAELDPGIYALYAAIRAGEVSGDALDRLLKRYRVHEEDRVALVALAAEAQRRAPPPEGGSVEGIYIFRVAARPRLDLSSFPRVRAVRDALDLAERLFERGRIQASVVDAVRAELAAGDAAGDAAAI